MAKQSGVGNFFGAWRRVALEEPRGQLQSDGTIVLWLQSRSGRFVDLRIPADGPRRPSGVKSFAGLGALTADAAGNPLFWWTRRIDYRAPGQPDGGLVRFLDDSTIEELSFLPGDDYREVWRLLEPQPQASSADYACDLTDATGARQGYFVVVGSYWGMALGRPAMERGVELLRSFFGTSSVGDVSGGPSSLTTGDAAGAAAYVSSYVCAIGRIDAETQTACIVHCTDARLEGHTLVPCSPGDASARELLAERLGLGRWTVFVVEEGCATDARGRVVCSILELLRGGAASATASASLAGSIV